MKTIDELGIYFFMNGHIIKLCEWPKCKEDFFVGHVTTT